MNNPTEMRDIAAQNYAEKHGISKAQALRDNDFKTKWSAYQSYIRGDANPARRRSTGQKMSSIRKEFDLPSRSDMSLKDKQLFLSRIQKVTPTIKIGKGRRGRF